METPVAFVRLVFGVLVEQVGDDLMVVVPGRSDVMRLSGHTADIVHDVVSGTSVHVEDPAVADLIDLGILTSPGLSRRGLIKAGAISAGAGVAVLAMPGVAAASSDEPTNDQPANDQPTRLVGGFSIPFTNALRFTIAHSIPGVPNTENLPFMPNPLPSTSHLDLSDLDVPELNLTGVEYYDYNFTNPDSVSFDWQVSSGVSNPDANVFLGYFSWLSEEFEVRFERIMPT
jgi:hypothetical protein